MNNRIGNTKYRLHLLSMDIKRHPGHVLRTNVECSGKLKHFK